jgi:hypothetical protein
VKHAKGDVKRVFFGCRTGHKPINLTADVSPKSSEDTHTSNVQFRLGGTYAAWVETSSSDFGAGEFGRAIVVRPLAPGGRSLGQDVTNYEVTGLAVRADGAAAWMLSSGPKYTEVDGVESGAKRPIPFAYARGIARDSLSLDDAAVHWKQDGTDRTGALR